MRRAVTLLVMVITALTGAHSLQYGKFTETYHVTLDGKTYEVPVEYYVWKNGNGHFVWVSLGVHPLEYQAHKCMFEAVKWFVYNSGEFKGTLVVSWIKIPPEYYQSGSLEERYRVSRDLGQLTFHDHVLPYVLHPEELGNKVGVPITGRPELFLDVHAHRPGWGVSEFILIPAGPVHGNDNLQSFRRALQICEVLAGVIGAKVDPQQTGTSPPWVTAPVAKHGIPAATFENGYYYIGRELPPNYDNYRTELDKALLEALYLYALEGGRVPPTPAGYRKLARWYAVAAETWAHTVEYLKRAAKVHPEYASELERLAEIAAKIRDLLKEMSEECERVAELLERGQRNEAARLVNSELIPEYEEVVRLYDEYISGTRQIPVKISDVFVSEEREGGPESYVEVFGVKLPVPLAAAMAGTGVLAALVTFKAPVNPLAGAIACGVLLWLSRRWS
ncbi:hypothetical protein [Methanopyrus sp.]